MKGQTGCSVLIIDDSVLARRALREALENDPRFGPLLEAENAAEGYSMFKAARPSAVFLDVELPDMSGLEVLKLMKSAIPRCVIVMFTTFTEVEIKDECLRRGADWFLTKGSALTMLGDTLHTLCLSAQLPGSNTRTKRTETGEDSGFTKGRL